MSYWFGKQVAWAKDHWSTSFSRAAAQLFIHEWTKNNGVHPVIRRRNSLNILNKTKRKESRIRKTYCSIDVIYFLRIDWGHWGVSVRKNLSVFTIRRLCKKLACVAGGIVWVPSNLTRLYYNGSAAKSHSTSTKYRQLRRLAKNRPKFKRKFTMW